ncbi:hypothetical protein [Umezawaea tangerina]|uniref:Uncharacterized protein n=1 Tax=Umezawaea tangerina TaxID=84725 RepID=A0A2T0TFR1_9PSEU|nr:hypothetical protein [Umezawaea tangerina]PRY44481.1 hypothetical protein CLV43_10246 [Umezawaea tangerina]
MGISGLFGGAAQDDDTGDTYSGYYVPVHTWTATSGSSQTSVRDLFAALDTLDDVYSKKADHSTTDHTSRT